MKTIDRDGLLLCELQAKTFELSVDTVAASSAIFVIGRFMNSKTAKWLDSGTILASNMQPADLLAPVEEQYGPSGYGSENTPIMKCTGWDMFIGIMLYTYQCSSVSVYKTIKPKELRGLFLPYIC